MSKKRKDSPAYIRRLLRDNAVATCWIQLARERNNRFDEAERKAETVEQELDAIEAWTDDSASDEAEIARRLGLDIELVRKSMKRLIRLANKGVTQAQLARMSDRSIRGCLDLLRHTDNMLK